MFNGYIDLVFSDEIAVREVALGRAGFVDLEEMAAAFDELPAVAGFSPFAAVRRDFEGRVVEQKPVTAQLIEQLLGESVDRLIQSGRSMSTFDPAPTLSIA
ncbi:hypothetical protein ACW0US_17935 [Xanthomonas euvesicatoria]